MKFTGAIVGLAVVAVGVGMGRIGAALVARNLDPAVVQRADAYTEAVLSGDPGRRWPRSIGTTASRWRRIELQARAAGASQGLHQESAAARSR